MTNITRTLADSRSVPNIIGIGPMNRIPQPLVFVPVVWDRIARRIVATKARMNPKITRANPIWVREKSLTFSQPSLNPEIFREL